MMVTHLFAFVLFSLGALTAPTKSTTSPELHDFHSSSSAAAFGFINQTVIYTPANNQALGYPRVTELSDGSLLIACTISGFYPAFIPIFKSIDGGVTWNWLSNVGVGGNDTTGFTGAHRLHARQDCDPDNDDCDPGDGDPGDNNPVGLGAQPFLLQLTNTFGQFNAGTILVTGNRMEADSTNIDLYASPDAGKSWQFVSNIAQGGPPTTGNGGSSIWEPFLMEYNGTVVAYYSDSRDDNYAQKLSHQTSVDLINWADPVDDVTYPDYADRPGMTVVTYIPPLSKYMLVYEHGNGTRSKAGNAYPDFYKLAADPLLFDAAPALAIEAKDMNGTIVQSMEPGSAPYVTWTPVGGANGTIIVTDANHKKLFINKLGGALEGWETRDVPQPHAYARALHVLSKYSDHLLIAGAGPFRPKQGDKTPLSVSVVNITALIAEQ